MKNIQVLVAGSLNTDITAAGVDRLLGSGELTRSGTIVIGPGGKSRNMAQMTAAILGPGTVAMVGKTSRDPFRLWEVPFRALEEAGVVTDYITIESFEDTGLLPGIALIPVNRQGENQIYCVPGISDSFRPEDIDRAEEVFSEIRLLSLTLEMPLATAIHAIQKANARGVPVILDPGGIDPEVDYTELLARKIFLMKPNEHEAKILTGIEVTGRESAKQAAQILLECGIEYVLITHGGCGAYLFSKDSDEQIDIPKYTAAACDETGCGDQVTAVMCGEILLGTPITEAARIAVRAGTAQYCRSGISPLSGDDIDEIRKEVMNG